MYFVSLFQTTFNTMVKIKKSLNYQDSPRASQLRHLCLTLTSNIFAMVTTVKGIYQNGRIVLDEVPHVKDNSKVLVTFLEESQPTSSKKRRLGSLKGKIGIPDNFNDPLDYLKEYMF